MSSDAITIAGWTVSAGVAGSFLPYLWKTAAGLFRLHAGQERADVAAASHLLDSNIRMMSEVNRVQGEELARARAMLVAKDTDDGMLSLAISRAQEGREILKFWMAEPIGAQLDFVRRWTGEYLRRWKEAAADGRDPNSDVNLDALVTRTGGPQNP